MEYVTRRDSTKYAENLNEQLFQSRPHRETGLLGCSLTSVRLSFQLLIISVHIAVMQRP